MGEFEQIPEIKERIDRSKMELQENGYYWSPEWDSQSCADQDFVNNFKKGWLYQQSKIEQLEKRIKEGLEKIEQCEKEGCLFPEWLYWAKKSLRGDCENQD